MARDRNGNPITPNFIYAALTIFDLLRVDNVVDHPVYLLFDRNGTHVSFMVNHYKHIEIYHLKTLNKHLL